MKKKMLDLSDVKLLRADKDKGLIYVWRGGYYIDSFHLGTQISTTPILPIKYPNKPTAKLSFSQVKNKMRAMMSNEI